MSKSWLKFFTLAYGFAELIFNLFQLVIGRIIYLLIEPNSLLSTILFIIVLFISCILYYVSMIYLIKQIRIQFSYLDKFLITIEKYDKEFHRKNRNY